ncbi:MAG: hypothetical protein CMC55_05920 [Flavobacteriaceae bacterium]|nr:hypothetical protein [Flavobacteriaceae bacterium]|tara:strand:- start:578 stop:796 length:219 start_codon:yes stop_codon:yes gene_type:complete
MVEVTLNFKSDISREKWIELLGKDEYMSVEDIIKTLSGDDSMCRISRYHIPVSLSDGIFADPKISIDLEIKH